MGYKVAYTNDDQEREIEKKLAEAGFEITFAPENLDNDEKSTTKKDNNQEKDCE